MSTWQGRYVVTGGAGFLGSHLCERLLAEGAEVICVDDLSSGPRRNVAPLLRNAKFSLVERNIVDGVDIDGGLAGIFHLASPASPDDYQSRPIATLRTCAEGTERMLRLAEQKRCPLLLTSTSEVYGDPEVHPQREEYWGRVNPIGPRSCYDEGKRYAEALAVAYEGEKRVALRHARIFNTYGPKMRLNDGRVIPNLCGQALRGESLTIYGDGKQTRSFCFVSELIDGLLRLFLCQERGPVNLGNPGEFTILELAQLVQKLSGKNLPIVHRPLPVDDPTRRRPDISRAKKLLQWEPKIPLAEGLRQTFESFRSEA